MATTQRPRAVESGTPGSGPARRAPRPPLFRHPWRIAIVVGSLLVVLNLGILLLNKSDTSRGGRVFPVAIDGVSPLPGEIIRPEDTVTADLRDDLTGVLVLDRQEVPEDQMERVVPLGQVSFRPGPDKDIAKFAPGQHTVSVLYWQQGKPRPAHPGSYGWSFRTGA